jgi:hypothetical protein
VFLVHESLFEPTKSSTESKDTDHSMISIHILHRSQSNIVSSMLVPSTVIIELSILAFETWS